jgi:DNA-binding GntR family transcriptional regulator
MTETTARGRACDDYLDDLAEYRQLREARDDLIVAAHKAGASEREIVEASGLARMTVRKALGK